MLQILPIRFAGRVASRKFSPVRALISPRPFSSTTSTRNILGLDRRDRRVERDSSTPRRRPTRWEVVHGKNREEKPVVKIYPAPLSSRSRCKDPIATFAASQLESLDPTGSRSRLFGKRNPEAAKVGDILLVRQRNGDPFAGVCLNIRRRGIDTAVLLRNQLTRVGVEMWYKIYSPNVEGIEVVQRRAKRARRARLYYMRQPKHDLGSVDNIVRQYQRRRQALRSGSEVKGRDANAQRRQHLKGR